MKKFWAICLTMLFAFVGTIPAMAHTNQINETAYIDVAVATLWTKPHQTRPMDQPAISNPVDLRKWTASMNLQDKLWLVGKLETQALLGNKVTILEKDGDWAKVVVHGQPTPRDSRGYPGWLPLKQLTYDPKFAIHQKGPFVIITQPTAFLYDDPTLHKKGMEISYNTRLPLVQDSSNSYLVMLPNGKKAWLKKADGQVYVSQQTIPKPSGQDLVNTGKSFLNLPYLWSGMSGFGFDCSGFTFTIHQAHGITIPRDSSAQFKSGKHVELKNLQPGDLLFFGTDQDPNKVHHVAMYIGQGKMIHSPNSARSVEIISIHTPGYKEELVGARRYVN